MARTPTDGILRVLRDCQFDCSDKVAVLRVRAVKMVFMSNDNSQHSVRLDVPYGGGPAGNLCVDLYLPTGPGAHPALLCLHGGAWLRGSQRQYKSWGPWLAERGYAVAAVDYRLSSQVSPAWPGVWEDVCRSLEWLNEPDSSAQSRSIAARCYRRLRRWPHGGDAVAP